MNKIIKDKTRLTVKLFIVVWIVLLIHVLLKVTFNYWQPYVIPNEQLQYISDYIDNHKILIILLDNIFYIINGYVMICCGLQKWHLGKNLNIITLALLIGGYYWGIYIENTFMSLFITIVFPLILNYKKWFWIILTFIFSFIFLALSLWLEGFINSNNMPYIIATFLNIDYYFMLLLNYFIFNFIRKRKESKNGK